MSDPEADELPETTELMPPGPVAFERLMLNWAVFDMVRSHSAPSTFCKRVNIP